jgi:hypothetical protein
VTREDVRRWVTGHRAAQAREQEQASADGPQPAAAVAAALALVALAGRLHGWPIAPDAIDLRDDAAARARWDRLRATLLPRGTVR